MEALASEIRELRRGLRDLVALTSLPAVWSESKPQEIAENLADVLISRLNLDLVYVAMNIGNENATFELVRTPQQHIQGEHARDIGRTFQKLFYQNNTEDVQVISDPLTLVSLYVAVIPLGHNASEGYIVAGVRGEDQLSEIHRLLLNVAANEAVTTLRQAQLIAELQEANRTKDALLQKELESRAESQRASEHLMVLQDLTSKLSRSMNVEQIAHVILEAGEHLFHSPRGAVYSYRDHGPTIYMLDQFGLDTVKMSPRSVSVVESLPVTDAIRTGKIVWIENTEDFICRYPQMEPRIRAENLQALAVIPFLIDDEVLGCLKLHFDGPRLLANEDSLLLSAIAQQCAQALERAYLNEKAQIAAAVEERQRLARELHDAVSQVLFAATVSAEAAVRSWERNPSSAFGLLEQVVSLNRAAMSEMRTLLLELRPESLAKASLSQLLTQLIESAKGRQEIEAIFTCEGQETTAPQDVVMTFYRISQESINNILRHSGATRLDVSLHYETSALTLSICDNGRGFDPNLPSPGLGLGSMRERAALINAQFTITSTPGKGTTVELAWTRPS
jgi:signal transduction histidine kinase